MVFGIPSVITSDQGGEFRNGLDYELMTLLGIDYRLTTPYHPQVRFICKHCIHFVLKIFDTSGVLEHNFS